MAQAGKAAIAMTAATGTTTAMAKSTMATGVVVIRLSPKRSGHAWEVEKPARSGFGNVVVKYGTEPLLL